MTSAEADAIRAAFRVQAGHCRDLGSPFTATLCNVLSEQLDSESGFGRRILEWTGDSGNDALALRAAGALHALARSRREPALTSAYPPNDLDRERLWQAVALAVANNDRWLTDYLDSPPQTNEVARSAALLGGCLTIACMTGMPLTLYEIGSSAGLNLYFDRYRFDLGSGSWGPATSPVRIASEWHGDVPPFDAPLSIAARSGVDIRPLNPASHADRERLRSYIWADQPNRLARTSAALDLAAASPTPVVQGDAADWVESVLEQPIESGVARVLMHTIVWQYLPKPSRQRIRDTLASAGANAHPDAPLAWLRMEYAGDSKAAGVTLRVWPDGSESSLGSADYHGRWTRWDRQLRSAA